MSIANLFGIEQRPDRTKGTKDATYHLQYARYTLRGLNDPLHNRFVNNSILNWSFYKNKQWIYFFYHNHRCLTARLQPQSSSLDY